MCRYVQPRNRADAEARVVAFQLQVDLGLRVVHHPRSDLEPRLLFLALADNAGWRGFTAAHDRHLGGGRSRGTAAAHRQTPWRSLGGCALRRERASLPARSAGPSRHGGLRKVSLGGPRRTATQSRTQHAGNRGHDGWLEGYAAPAIPHRRRSCRQTFETQGCYSCSASSPSSVVNRLLKGARWRRNSPLSWRRLWLDQMMLPRLQLRAMPRAVMTRPELSPLSPQDRAPLQPLAWWHGRSRRWARRRPRSRCRWIRERG